MTEFVRGTIITFEATCTDAAGAPVTPDSAAIYLVYKTGPYTRNVVEETLAMSISGSVASVDWDSSVASPGGVRWSIRTSGPDKIALDGTTILTANAANPAP